MSAYQIFDTMQTTIHKDLVKKVAGYAKSNYLRPLPLEQVNAFLQIKRFSYEIQKPLILDSGCGTGLSSIKIAEQFLDHGVVGVDKSVARLGRARQNRPNNCLLVRGDLIDIWRLCAAENLSFARHYLLFPNPWPKIGQFKRRFHAHPVFKTMMQLAPYFELRTNWQIYAEECATAFETLGQKPVLSRKTDTNYLTLFEKKYLLEGCPIYLVTNTLASDHA